MTYTYDNADGSCWIGSGSVKRGAAKIGARFTSGEGSSEQLQVKYDDSEHPKNGHSPEL